uniref:MgtC/SapB/SrpB/YhiD N-terminal domain-containing protein n=1 Tax=Ditylum brightwellii TaxID=49249 RepID=A0A6S9BE96_9STRA|mmetsp:Transcript_31099/g.46352  ORF Transcript_31099/g.46352 Transcript_31099/m.46352 type:complete len:320 (+) Transcript_31099:189-1148(+)
MRLFGLRSASGLTAEQHIVSHTPGSPYFTDFTWSKGIFYSLAVIYVCAAFVVVTVEPFLSSNNCHATLPLDENGEPKQIEFENALFVYDPCRYVRLPQFAYLTREECMFGRRLVAAVILGGIVGWERRQSDRPAGIRTMSLVSLGSCLFSICSAFAFLSGPMSWDASRVSAAIPSGVGFLGSALIFKNAKSDSDSSNGGHTVSGLTTATSVWLSAAVGIACGGGLYFAASFCVAIMLVVLRFGPRWSHKHHDDDSHGALNSHDGLVDLGTDDTKKTYDSFPSAEHTVPTDPEFQPLKEKTMSISKTKKRRLKKQPSLID